MLNIALFIHSENLSTPTFHPINLNPNLILSLTNFSKLTANIKQNNVYESFHFKVFSFLMTVITTIPLHMHLNNSLSCLLATQDLRFLQFLFNVLEHNEYGLNTNFNDLTSSASVKKRIIESTNSFSKNHTSINVSFSKTINSHQLSLIILNTLSTISELPVMFENITQ